MRNRADMLLLLAPAMLAGCSAGPGATHPQCVDAASTEAYGVKWQEDLAKAREAGKLTLDQVVDTEGKAYRKLGLLRDSNWSEYCHFLDSVRNETGF